MYLFGIDCDVFDVAYLLNGYEGLNAVENDGWKCLVDAWGYRNYGFVYFKLNYCLDPVRLYCLLGLGEGLRIYLREDLPGLRYSIEDVLSSSFEGLLLIDDLARVNLVALRTDFYLY